MRFVYGALLTFCAWGLLYINHEVWALLPAVAAVYLLGSQLWDFIRFGNR